MSKIDVKKENASVSRGYCGYYNGWYLRSLREYQVARYLTYLSDKFKQLTIGYELNYKTYIINGKSYKPDFFIFRHDKLRYIVEVKSNKAEAERCIDSYTDFFAKKNIRYIVTYLDADLRTMNKRSNVTTEELEDWRNKSIYDYNGKNNPSYGRFHSDESKRLIGRKTIERNQSEEWRQYHSKRVKDAMTDDVRKKISNSRKRTVAKKRAEADKFDPLIDSMCRFCGGVIHKRRSQINRMHEEHQGCSYKCTIRLREKAGLWSSKLKGKSIDISRRLRNDIIKTGYQGIVTDEMLQLARTEGIIAKNSPLSTKSLTKYFNSTDVEDILRGKN